MTSSPGRHWTPMAIWLPWVPEGTKSAAPSPSRSAIRSSSARMVGSSPYTSSPTSASAIARRIPGVGRVTVSERRSMGAVGTRGPYYNRGMPRDTLAERKVRAGKVLDLLDQAMPDAHIELDYGTPLQLI